METLWRLYGDFMETLWRLKIITAPNVICHKYIKHQYHVEKSTYLLL